MSSVASDHVGNECGPAFTYVPPQDRASFNAREGIEGFSYLFRLDAISANLNLIVQATDKCELSIFMNLNSVASPIDACRFAHGGCIPDELLGRKLRPSYVPAADRRP